jgi:hypothetical protein
MNPMSISLIRRMLEPLDMVHRILFLRMPGLQHSTRIVRHDSANR